MESMEEKYQGDPAYRYCVDTMEALIHNNQFTPSEMREMAVLACINYEARRPIHRVVINKETEEAFKVLQELKENKHV